MIGLRKLRTHVKNPSEMSKITKFPNKVGIGGRAGEFPHILGIEELEPARISEILDLAQNYARGIERREPPHGGYDGLTLINLFFENSTRTLLSFELAAKRLGMNVASLPIATSSINKGEGILDTARTLDAMAADVIAVRHPKRGTASMIADNVDASVINAGDGTREHPTQALLDALTMIRHKGSLEGLTVSICGDVCRSRVAGSNLHLLRKMGAKVTLVGPASMLPEVAINGVRQTSNFDEGIKGADVVMMLRIQKERMAKSDIPSPQEYFADYGLTAERLETASPDVIVMHPGPMNRYVEITPEVADHSTHSVILEQVTMGVAVRMACLDILTRDRRA